MTVDSEIIKRLTGLSRADIVRDLQRVRDAQSRLELEEQLLRALLDLVPDRPSKESGRDSEGADVLFQADDGTTTVVQVKHASEAGASKRAMILGVIEGQPDRIWRMSEIEPYLVEAGIEMTKQNLRMTLRRMAQAGQIEKVADGRYQAKQDRAEDET